MRAPATTSAPRCAPSWAPGAATTPSPFTDGWERRAGDSGGSLSTVYVADLAYRTDYRTQTDPYYTVTGGARLDDPTAAARTRDGLTGYCLGGRRTFWRAGGGTLATATPTALSSYASFTHGIGQEAGNGVASMANAGVALAAPWAGRPLDSYALNLNWAQLTRSQQHLLEAAYRSAGGTGDYDRGRESVSLGVDGNFVLGRGVVFSTVLAHVWNASNWKTPYSDTIASDGYTFNLVLHLQLDQWLGLNHS